MMFKLVPDDARSSQPRTRGGDIDIGLSIDDLTELIGSRTGLDVTLHRLADWGMAILPGVDGLAIRVIDGDRSEAVVTAGPPVIRTADELQFALGEGPSLDAARSGTPSSCGSLGGAHQWPRLGPRIGRMGLHSVLSVPLLLPGRVVGTATAYARGRDAFDEHAIDAAQKYALPAAVVIDNASALDQTQATVAQLTEALRVRPVIDRAVGILMSRTGKSADDALATLRRMSNVEHVKVAELARRIVDSAVEKANQRRRTALPISADFTSSSAADPTYL